MLAPAVSPTILAAERTPQPGQREERGRQAAHERADLALERVGSHGQLPAAHKSSRAMAATLPGDAGKARLELGQHVVAPQAPGRDLKAREQLVEVPAQPALDARALRTRSSR